MLRVPWGAVSQVWPVTAAGLRCFSRLPRKVTPGLRTGAETGALERMAEQEETLTLPQTGLPPMPPPEGALIVRRHNAPAAHAGSTFPKQVYPGHPLNFTPLRQPQSGFSSLDRAVRDFPMESRFDLIDRALEPRYGAECRGTPRREYQEGLVGGIRVRPVQNPYVVLTPSQRYQLNTWASRSWKSWDPRRAHVRGSRRAYRLPEDIKPYKDELGEWHPPRISGRYRADIEKQYKYHGIPWVWKDEFYRARTHMMDREPQGRTYWYRKQYRAAKISEALKKMDGLVEDFRKERREGKRLSWVERIVLEFCGEQLASPFVRTRRLPKM
mmetsp:Transcript_29491/g.77993  ORF Transcript_29491/g.77993 Transcript_29491/m.77993 type:complete len:327 (-) Transcript_29491:271-1251(-)